MAQTTVFQETGWGKRKKYPAYYSERIAETLKKYGILKADGTYDLSDADKVRQAETELTWEISEREHHRRLKENLVNILKYNTPSRYLGNFIGDSDNPGIIDEIIGQQQSESKNGMVEFGKFEQKGVVTEGWQGFGIGFVAAYGSKNDIDISSPNFQKAIAKADSEAKDWLYGENGSISALKNNPSPIREIVKSRLELDKNFQRLTKSRQAEVINQYTSTTIEGLEHFSPPSQIHEARIGEKDGKLNTAVTPVSKGGVGEKVEYESIDNEDSFAAKEAKRQLEEYEKAQKINPPSGSAAALQGLIQDFSRDPIGTALRWGSTDILKGFLPKPIHDFLKKKKGWSKKYQLSISPDGPKIIIQDALWKAFKEIGSHAGLFHKETKQFMPMYALGWAVDRTFTAAGEGLGKLFGRNEKGLVRGIFSRRIGKDRNRKDNALLSLGKLLFDLASLGIKRLLGLIGKYAAKIPVVKTVQNWIKGKFENFRVKVELKFPAFKYARIGFQSLKAFVYAIPHGLGTGGLVYLATGGNAPWALGLGSADLVWNTFRNLIRIPEVYRWATGSHTTGIGNFLGKAMTSRWAYLPIKSPFFTLAAMNIILPLFGIQAPLWAKAIGFVLSGALEYGYFVSIRPLLVGKLPDWALKYLSRPLGKFFGQGAPGFLLGLQLGSMFGLVWWKILLLGLGGNALWFGLVQLFPKLFGFNLFSLLGYIFGIWLGGQLGLTGILAIFFPYLTGIIATYLGGLGWTALMNWLGSMIHFSVLGAGGAAAGIAATSTASILISLGLTFGLSLLAIAISASAFILYEQIKTTTAPPESECFRLSKTVQIKDKNTGAPKTKAEAGDWLEYTIKLNPKLNNIKGAKLKDIFLVYQCPDNFFGPQRQSTTLLDEKTFAHISIPVGTVVTQATPSASLSATSGTSSICKDNWYEVNWYWQTNEQNPSPTQVTAANDEVSFRIQVAKTYQSGSIMNQAYVEAEGIKDNGSKAKCPAGVWNYVNSSAQVAADVAKRLVDILNSCTLMNGDPRVTRDTFSAVVSCLSTASIDQRIIDSFQSAVNRADYGYMLQCGTFVRAIDNTTGGNLPSLSFARDYWKSLQGYRQINKSMWYDIIPGDILVWTSGSYGHIAIATSIQKDFLGNPASITIAEAMGDTGLVRERTLVITENGIESPGLEGWQRRNY